MYNAIMLSEPEKKSSVTITELCEFTINHHNNDPDINTHDQLYQEAVFSGGKTSLKPMEDQLGVVRNILLDEIDRQEKSENSSGKSKDDKRYKFNPESFWKHQEVKKLENVIKDIFGFRSVTIQPYIEKYISKDKQFESKEIQCLTYSWDRYPIDGLVTDKGFYDNTHSITLDIRVSLGLIKTMEPGELTAVILHEIGHNIDPAMVTITYTQVNTLSKYLTDRNNDLSKAEKKYIKEQQMKHKNVFAMAMAGLLTITGIVASIIGAIGIILSAIFKKKSDKSSDTGASGAINESMMKRLKEAIEKDVKTEFSKKDFNEAFADNFARMYGYGVNLSTAFKKMDKHNESMINSRFKRERERQRCIMNMVYASLNNAHKTDIHRIKALIRLYRDDINDPNTPAEVKNQLEEDVKEVEKVLDSYMNDFSDFQNKINKMISDEIDKQSSENNKQAPKEIKESVDVTYFDESKKAYEELMKRKKTLTPAERKEIKDLFGNSNECSFAKDDKGYYCYTHRCRSKSYKSISMIPMKDVEFVRSTS